MEREFDVIVWGATGFTGQLVAQHLCRRHGTTGDFRWALGGRNETKLKSVRDNLGESAANLPLVLGESLDTESMASVAQKAKVICSTVGPYAKYGSPIVQACAENGTDYCDLTGELHWMQKMIDTHSQTAQSSGARLVHTCGFDCIPSDLGTWFIQKEMQRLHGTVAPHVKMRVQAFRGGASGGTIASMLNMMEEAKNDPSVMQAMNHPYAINPEGERDGPDGPESFRPHHDEAFGEWVAPFVMAGVDTKVVRRTNALLDYSYGRDFRYDEGMLMGSGPIGAVKAGAVTAGVGGGMALATLSPVRNLLAQRMPSPGEGPSPETQASGFFDLRFFAQHPSDSSRCLHARVTADRDPGYGATSRMLGEAAACLARDDLTKQGGFWTPASIGGMNLLERLTDHAGMSFELIDPPQT
ncbi:MAG: saccharopine dehydrogenase NADP-binding domain-containing protein [Myxococcota bacterium]|nr:saccharopine dehydrogenase NADP-binding domain-containing protein [Myxococcota bacterium]